MHAACSTPEDVSLKQEIPPVGPQGTLVRTLVQAFESPFAARTAINGRAVKISCSIYFGNMHFGAGLDAPKANSHVTLVLIIQHSVRAFTCGQAYAGKIYEAPGEYWGTVLSRLACLCEREPVFEIYIHSSGTRLRLFLCREKVFLAIPGNGGVSKPIQV